MKVLFVTFAPIAQTPAGPTSDLASVRYRVLIPAQQLARLGHTAQIAVVPPGGQQDSVLRDLQADVYVFSKSFDPANERLAAELKARGGRIVVDFCDDHFEHPERGPHFYNMVALADQVVASTARLGEAIKRHTGRAAMEITDPVEGPRRVPSFAPGFPSFRILWFGHPSNLGGLQARQAELQALAHRVPISLRVVTAVSPKVESFVQQIAGTDPTRLTVEAVPWSTEATWRELARSDAVWIPALDTDQKAVKSPNRLVEALWAGRLVVADPVPSYLPFSDFTPIGTGLAEGILAALADPARVLEGLRKAQRRISRVHSPLECGRLWACALGDRSERPMRLNLGCGDKILPGYVNVDVVEARAGMKPDVICDLHDLAPFEQETADEILSVHVVEHFWRWEIAGVLREWTRVLKRGGKMIVECPNLASACATFLENPEAYSREDRNGQRTMWVFYGDPAWKDPLMIHRWGYTPESLKRLLSEVGLTDIRQEPAQFKLREPRDMRIVGTKA